jgi:sulfite oxidase
MTNIRGKAADFIVRQAQPLNGGPAVKQMAVGFITPNEQFFVRNHGEIPTIDVGSFRLRVDGLVNTSLHLSLEDIRAFPSHELAATLQCAGQRREELLAVGPIPNEIIWNIEAMSTATWRGARLRDVLAASGVRPGAQHVALTGLDRVEKGEYESRFGGSIPLQKALDEDTLLAYEMNGVPLLPAHGFPLRLLVPGYVGARSVKWLAHICVQDQASDNYFQQVAYRLIPPHPVPEGMNPGVMLGDLPITSVICEPEPDAVVGAGLVRVRGCAFGGARKVIRVDLSADGGSTWQCASLLGESTRWAWRLWEAQVTFSPGIHELVVRAWDEAASTQPERLQTVWNPKGYVNNAWHRVRIRVM